MRSSEAKNPSTVQISRAASEAPRPPPTGRRNQKGGPAEAVPFFSIPLPPPRCCSYCTIAIRSNSRCITSSEQPEPSTVNAAARAASRETP